MRRLLFIPLLALPLLFMSCDGQVPSEPSADASGPTFAKATTPVPLGVLCPTCSDVAGPHFYTDESWKPLYYTVCPAAKGTIQVYNCRIETGVMYPASDCVSGAREWNKVREFKYRIDPKTPGSCTAYMFNVWGSVVGQGWMLKYRPQGSGYYSGTYVFDAHSSAGPT